MNKKGLLEKIFSKLKWLDPFTYVDEFVMPRVKKISDSIWLERFVTIFFAGLFAVTAYFLLSIVFGSSTPLVIVYSESMEPLFFRGDIIGLTSVKKNSFFGEEIFLNKKINGLVTSDFVKPSYSNGSLEKIVFFDEQEFDVQKNIENKKLFDNPVIVYNSFPTNIPIIHRSLIKIIALDGNFVLTKGDNQQTNPTFDQDCGRVIKNNNGFIAEQQCISLYAIPINEIQGVRFLQVPKIGCLKLWLFDDLISLITTGKLPKDFKGIC